MTADRYARLRETATFRGDGFTRWQHALLGVIGCGTLGSRLAPEIVRSGANVWMCDFGQAETHNLGTQAVRAGLSKVETIVRACDEIRPGASSGMSVDIRRVGVGVLRQCDVLVDCSDDPRLAYVLTEVANGLGKPLLRVAVDGSGKREFGRVVCSDATNGSCQICTHTFEDLAASRPRQSCPGAPTPARPATHAGGALASVMAGIALLQAQRLVTGNDLDQVRDREILVDLELFSILPATVRRSADCLSGHVAWDLVDMPSSASTCLGDVYDEAARLVGDDQFALEPYGHAWCLHASCECGAGRAAVGSIWAPAPTCVSCGKPMKWQADTQVTALQRSAADDLGILPRTLTELGLPEQGALFVARIPDRPPVRLVLGDTRPLPS
ncbi:MAG: ThiF family adenylyltransferase [Planctomycetaceae bacterium]